MSIIQKVKQSKALKQSALMTFGNVFSSGIAAIALIIFSRLLGPEKYGIFSVGFSSIMLISKLSDGGINIAVQRNLSQVFEKDKKKANQFIKIGTDYKILVSGILAAAFLLFSKTISIYLLKTEEVTIVRLAIILALVTIAYNHLALILQSIMKFKDFIIMNVSQATSKAIAAITLLLLNINNPTIAFVTYAACPIIGVIYGIYALPSWITTKIKVNKSQYKAINKILKFTSIAMIVGAISDNIDVLIVKSFLTNFETGLYSAGTRLSMLVAVLSYSLGTVLNPRVARYKSAKHFNQYVTKAILISLAAIAGSVLVLPLAKPLILITAGKEYLQAVPAVRYLLAAGFLVVATTPLVSMFYVVKKTQYFAYRGVIQMIVLISANLILIPKLGIVGAGMARLITRITALIFTAIYAAISIRQQYKINFAKEFKNIQENK